MSNRTTKRTILANALPQRKNCKFGADGCMLEAKTKNRFDVPMCDPCYAQWKVLVEPKIDWDEAWLEMVRKKKSSSIEDDDEPTDEFYCGNY